MKSFTTALFALMFIQSLFAQISLPNEWYISQDGHKIICGKETTDGLYDKTQIRRINFDFLSTNYWSQMTSNYTDKINIPAVMSIDGEVMDTIGIRFKGQTSYFMNNSQKKSLAIDTEWWTDKGDAMGYEALNLNCGYLDQSSMREMLFFDLGRRYIPMAKAAYTTVSLNGQDWGLYTNIQQLDGDFIRDWFPSNNGTRWRCEREGSTGGPGGGGPGGGGGGPNFGAGTSSFNYLGTDTSLYAAAYDLKKTSKENPWEDLIAACDVLENAPLATLEEDLKNLLDVDRSLWQLAVEILFTDDDSYIFKGGMDYFAYWEPETGRLTPLEYDGNTCMELDKANTWSVFYRETDNRFALMYRLMQVPALRQRYLAHVRTILNESFDLAMVNAKIDAYAAQIDSIVQADPKKIYSYNQFTAAVDELKEFFEERHDYISNNTEVNRSVPTIQSVVYSADNQDFTQPNPTQSCWVRANVASSTGLSEVVLYYGTGVTGAFEKTTMYDDGQHQDGSANDGIFGGEIPAFAPTTLVRFYISAIADDGFGTVQYEPQGAEHDVYFYQVVPDGSYTMDVVINEFMASNQTFIADQDGEFDDWIELYNKGTQTVDLSGYHLSDNPDNRPKYTIPAGTTIAPDSYLIVWADEDGPQAGLHANFKLSAAGEQLWLWSPDTLTQIDYVDFGLQETDKGYARVPNGTGPFQIQNATFGANNETSSASDVLSETQSLTFSPNPSSGLVWLNLEKTETVRVFNALGQQVLFQTVQPNKALDLTALPNGTYTVRIEHRIGKVVKF